ncbi:hypothetical protein D3C75_633030 [compost metagenome]
MADDFAALHGEVELGGGALAIAPAREHDQLVGEHDQLVGEHDHGQAAGHVLGLGQAIGEGGRVERDMAALTLVVGLGMEGGAVTVRQARHGAGDVDALVMVLVRHGLSRSLMCAE